MTNDNEVATHEPTETVELTRSAMMSKLARTDWDRMSKPGDIITILIKGCPGYQYWSNRQLATEYTDRFKKRVKIVQ